MLDGSDTATRVSQRPHAPALLQLLMLGRVTVMLVLIDICVVTVPLPLIVLSWSTASSNGADPR